MKFFLDTAEIKDIRALAETGLIDGVTTNPTLIYKSGRDFKEVIREICDALPDGDISAEVIATDTDGMIEEGKRLAEIAENVVVKLPLTLPGISACSALAMEGIRVNVTLCFSPAQAILAAKAGAAYVSPFVGRLDDVGNDGMALIREIVTIFSNYPDFDCEVLAASVRHPQHVVDCAKAGANVVTLPPSVFSMLFNHPLTDKGLSAFLSDWAKTNQKV